MDQTLRCNSLPCRKLLYTQGRAVSTSCSHIFCHECAVTLFRGRRACPACETQLESPDDCIVTNLNPTSSYKASILAGLTPSVIMEICTRAIGFYQYQASQEAAFQQVILNKSQDMLERYALENENMERRAETESNLLKQKMKVLQDELEGEKTKNQELRQTMQTMRRDHEKLRGQLDTARRKAIGGSVGSVFPIEASQSSVSTSAPQPFYSGRSMNSPVPFLTNSQAETRQQTNLWQHQMQQHSPPPPPSQQQQPRNIPVSLQQQQQNNINIPRKSVGPMPQSRADIEKLLPRGANTTTTSSHVKMNPISIANRGLHTPIRAMPSPGYASPQRGQGGHMDSQLRGGPNMRLHDQPSF